MIANRFRSYIRQVAPKWLSAGDGGLVLGSLGIMLDAVTERVRLGLRARFPELAPTDALVALARDKRVIRGLEDTDASLGARVRAGFDSAKVWGSSFGLMDELRAYLGQDWKIRTVDNSSNWYEVDTDGTRSWSLQAGNWDWDGHSELWSRFWVIIYADGAPIENTNQWGDPLEWGEEGLTWGSTASSALVKSIRAIVKLRKPAGTRCPYIIIAFDPASFDMLGAPGAPLPDGTWGPPAKLVGGQWVTTRLDTAAYWKGTS